jgi:hypothetical protein
MTGRSVPARIWLPLVVFAVALSGMLAYRYATVTVVREPVVIDGNWNAVLAPDRTHTFKQVTNRLQERVEIQSAERRGGAVARRWVTALPVDAPHHREHASRMHASATADVRSVARWAAGLPSGRVTVQQSGVTRVSGTGESAAVRTPVTMSVRVRSATRADRTMDTKFVVTLVPDLRAGTDLRQAVWKVLDVSIVGESGLRAINQPILVARTNVDVVAQRSDLPTAQRYADEAQRSYELLRTRYAAIGVPQTGALFLVGSERKARQVLGVAQSAPHTVKPAAWMWEDGDIVLLGPRLRGEPILQQLGTVRHEVAHLVTLPLLQSRKVSTMLLEGIAVHEEARLITTRTTMIDLTSLHAAFTKRSLGYDQLLRSREAYFGRTRREAVDNAYLAGYATIRHLEERFGHDNVVKLFQLLESGADIDQALAQTTRLTARQLGLNVRQWTAAEVRKQGSGV